MSKKEYILCAAIHYDDGIIHELQPKGILTGVVISGWRHGNCIATLKAMLSGKRYFVKAEAQGFLTSQNRFINRKEAFQLMKENNPDWKPFDEFNDELFSEDLY